MVFRHLSLFTDHSSSEVFEHSELSVRDSLDGRPVGLGVVVKVLGVALEPHLVDGDEADEEFGDEADETDEDDESDEGGDLYSQVSFYFLLILHTVLLVKLIDFFTWCSSKPVKMVSIWDKQLKSLENFP